MKKSTHLLIFLLTFNFLCNAQQITLIDFGISTEISAGNWNNVTDSSTLNSTTNLIDSSGINTGEVLLLTDAFNSSINGFGTQSPDAGLPFLVTATRDNFFGESIEFSGTDTEPSDPSLEPTGGFTFSGLDVAKYYSFKIFASRETTLNDNRETLYTITGNAGPQTAILDATNNTTNVGAIFNITPNESGEITLQAEKGPNNNASSGGIIYNFYYLGAIEMAKTDTALSTDSFSIAGAINIYPNPSSELINISLSLKETTNVKMTIYDINGKFIKTILNEEKPAGSFVQKWNSSSMSPGLYILQINAGDKKYKTKLMLK